jgi:hypothetical protein
MPWQFSHLINLTPDSPKLENKGDHTVPKRLTFRMIQIGPR